MALEINIRDIEWKPILNMASKVLMDVKVLGALVGVGLVIWQSNDTFFVPTGKEMEFRKTALEEQKKLIEQRQQTKQQHDIWQRELKGLATKLTQLKPEDNARIVALSRSSELLELANAMGRDEKDPNALPPPHNKLTSASIEATGNSLFEIKDSSQPAQQEAVAPMPTPHGGGDPGAAMGAASIRLEKFDYTMTVRGTYAAVCQFINQLVSQEQLVVIDEVMISKVDNSDEPDVAEFPDYPVPVEMSLKFSLYLYDPQQRT